MQHNAEAKVGVCLCVCACEREREREREPRTHEVERGKAIPRDREVDKRRELCE